jgi:hypothetical protein
VYVPTAKLTWKVKVVGLDGWKALEHGSGPGGQSGLTPFLSTSTKNRWIVSVLVNIIVRVSPCATVMVGLGLVEEEFHAFIVPTRDIVRVVAACVSWIGARRTGAERIPTARIMRVIRILRLDRFSIGIVNLLLGS